jgi:hypothetical protein
VRVMGRCEPEQPLLHWLIADSTRLDNLKARTLPPTRLPHLHPFSMAWITLCCFPDRLECARAALTPTTPLHTHRSLRPLPPTHTAHSAHSPPHTPLTPPTPPPTTHQGMYTRLPSMTSISSSTS